MGALFTVNPPGEPEAQELPWIVTIGPLDDADDWEPVLCGPYERPHALALARAVVATEELMAVVEPVQPYISVHQIQAGIAEARSCAENESERSDLIFGQTPEAAMAAAVLSQDDAEEPDGTGRPEQVASSAEDVTSQQGSGRLVIDDAVSEDVPDPDQVRAGFVRIAKRLSER